LPEIRAGWIVSGAADPAVSRKDHGRNIRAYGIGDIAAADAAAADGISRVAAGAAANGISRAAAIPITVTVPPAAETEAAIVTVPVITAKEPKGENRAAAVESGEAAAMKTAAVKTAATVKAAAMKAAGKTAATVKAAEAASRRSGSGE
jgi:hypothetical protein